MGWIGPAITAGGAIVGGLVGGNQEHRGPGNLIPNHLRNDWRNFGNRIADLPRQEYYPGQTVAPMNPMYGSSIQSMYNFGSPGGIGDQLRTQTQDFGQNALRASTQGINVLDMLQNQGPGTFNYDQGTFNQIMGNLMPGLQGQYDAAMRDPNRQFNEQIIPGINMGAAGSGQSFGTRPQNASAIAARGLADRGADTASALWANAANQANAGGMAGGTLNLDSLNKNNQLLGQVANSYQNLGQLGLQGANQAYNMGTGNVEMQNNAGKMDQAFSQQLVDADRARWEYNQQAPWNDLHQRQALMGQNTGIPQGTPGMNGGMSTFEAALNGAQAAYGLYDMYRTSQIPRVPYVPQANNDVRANPMYDLNW